LDNGDLSFWSRNQIVTAIKKDREIEIPNYFTNLRIISDLIDIFINVRFMGSSFKFEFRRAFHVINVP